MIWWILLGVLSLLVLWALQDIIQLRHAVVRTLPIIGPFRSLLVTLRPVVSESLFTTN